MSTQYQIHAHAPITTVCDAIAHSTLYVVPSNQLLPPITYPAVAIKEVRILPQDPVVSVVANSIQSLLTAQSGLDHPNLWPVLGYTSKHGLPAIVTPYCSLGDVVQYTHRYPQTQQSRLKLIFDIAQATSYLHRNGFAHKNINPMNVLINAYGSGCLSDTGIFALMYGIAAREGCIPHSWPYKSLDELCSQGTPNLQECQERDVYSFACTAYKILSGATPYPYPLQSHNVWRNIQQLRSHGHLAILRPRCITEPLWSVLQSCWADPQSRPSMAVIVRELEIFL